MGQISSIPAMRNVGHIKRGSWPSFPSFVRRTQSETASDQMIVKRTIRVTSVYQLGQVLGRGKFGVTRLATHKKSGKEFACKSIAKKKLESAEEEEAVKREVAIMHLLSGHEHIIEFVDVYEDKDDVHIVMELCTGGELFTYISEQETFTEHDAACMLRGMLRMVAHCHDHYVVHRDLKPENFLISHIGPGSKLKAIDFGVSEFCAQGGCMSDVIGSLYYIAPEVLRKNYSFAADVWSCGVILYILLCGEPPFQGNTNLETFVAILEKDLEENFEKEPWPHISDAAKDCIRRMLKKDPAKRPTARQILRDKFLIQEGAAQRDPLDNAVLKRMKEFSGCNKLKKYALKLMVGQIPEEETEGLRRIFEQIDADKSGTITVEELKMAMEKKGALTEEVELLRLVRALDLNDDGSIDYEEFLAANVQLGKLDSEANILYAFNSLDLDRNKYITKDEIVSALQVHDLTEEEIDMIVSEVDANGDGLIDYPEFRAMIKASG